MKPEEMIKDIERLYGSSADDFIERLPHGSHADRKAWLMEQGLHSNHAGAVLWWEKNGAAIRAGGGELIDRQYAGGKAALRPIYERVAEVIDGFEDVEVGPRGTYVSFGRPKQFALVQPSTRTRVDVGLRLPDDAGDGPPRRRGLVRLVEHHAQGRAGGGRGRRRRARGLAARTASARGLVTASLATPAADRGPTRRRPSSPARGRRRGPRGRRRSRARGARGGPRRPRARPARR